MIIETKNSTYEIEGDMIRKTGGEPSDRHEVGENWVAFQWLHFKPEVGGRLIVVIDDGLLRTSTITSVVVDAQNEDEV